MRRRRPRMVAYLGPAKPGAGMFFRRHGGASLGHATRRALLSIGLGALAVACLVAGAVPIDTQPNPHGSPDGCRSCHEAKDGAVQPIDPKKIDRLCLGCHDGAGAGAEAHPIGRSFDSPQIRRPAEWPALDGLLSCLTCHDVVRHCRADARPPVAGANFLRGTIRGGDPSYCAQCHVESLHQRRNPHRMLDDGGRPHADACAFCHAENLTTRTTQPRAGTPHLRSDEITLCGACHQSHPDFFTPGHIGATFRNETCSKALQRNAEAPNPLPVPDGRRIVCSTCHNPHQHGVFPTGNPLAMGAMDPAAPGGMVPLRISGAGLCSNCHGK